MQNLQERSSGKQAPLLKVENLSKFFGGAKALDNAFIEVRHKEVHGLLGHNGSGKSTFIKILAGFHEPEPGATLWFKGQEIELPLPFGAARDLGISFVHQHLGLLPTLTVLENFLLSDLSNELRWNINWNKEAKKAKEFLRRYNLDFDLYKTVQELSPVERALLAIVRAFRDLNRTNNEGLLILDEPTPFLPKEDVDRLFTLVRQVVQDGAGVIFVSHDIDEVLEITDRATVLRDGRVAGAFTTKSTNKISIVEMIVGHKVEQANRLASTKKDKLIARIEKLTGDFVKDFSLSISAGEIVGLTGLIGSGFDEAPYLLYGSKKALSGELYLNENNTKKRHQVSDSSPKKSIRNGIILIPADRQNNAIIGSIDITENVNMPMYRNLGSSWRIRYSKLNKNAIKLMETYDVRPRNSDMLIQDLSGGNQQKAVMAKWLQLNPKIILLDEPTQGVDVGAREQLFGHLKEMASNGAAVIIASSDFEQLESICDRVLVFNKGLVISELSGDDVNKNTIAEHCFGAESTV